MNILVLSPHLDDAILSLGATINSWTSAGWSVTVLTALSGNPDSDAEANPWDASCGFLTEGEATRARLLEDWAACKQLNASPNHFYFTRDTVDEGGIIDAINNTASDLILAPGYPLVHEHHMWLFNLAIHNFQCQLYAEQPYVENEVLDGAWKQSPVTMLDIEAKKRAIRQYRSQLVAFSDNPFRASRIARRKEWIAA